MTGNPFLPSARLLPGANSGGAMAGGPPRVVWHTTESDPGSIAGVVRYLIANNSCPHLVWDPSTGELVQLLRADVAGRALMHPAGTPQTNRQGAVCLQIEVVGRAAHPFTQGPMAGREGLLAWLSSFGVPRVYAAPGRMSWAAWVAFSGHCGHLHVPGNDHVDPGAIDPVLLLATSAPSTPATTPRRFAMVLFGARGIDHATADLVHQLTQIGVVTCDAAEAKAAIARGETVVVVGGPAAAALEVTAAAGQLTEIGKLKVAIGRDARETLNLALQATA